MHVHMLITHNGLTSMPQASLHVCCYVQSTMGHLMHNWTQDDMCLSLRSSLHTLTEERKRCIGLTIVMWYVHTIYMCGVEFLWHSLFLETISEQYGYILHALSYAQALYNTRTSASVPLHAFHHTQPQCWSHLDVSTCTYRPSVVELRCHHSPVCRPVPDLIVR